jgi:1,4-alpha-glucan branching enzyme
MSLKKQNAKSKSVCKVTFTLAENIADSSGRVNLVGDFNNWDIDCTPMKKLKNGNFAVSIDLEKGKEYQFRYLVEGLGWLNEKEADKHVLNNYQTENSVISL